MGSIKEDNKFIYISNNDSIKDLTKFNTDNCGTYSSIYYYKDDLLKIFNDLMDIDSIQIPFFEFMKALNTTNIVLPKKYALLEKKLCGYSVKKINGKILSHIDPNIEIIKFIQSFNTVVQDIKVFSENNIYMHDINYTNILYDNSIDSSFIIDTDFYRLDLYSSNLFSINLFNLYSTIIASLFVFHNSYKISNYLLSFAREYADANISIVDTFNYLIDNLEKYSDIEINKIKDLKKVKIK